MLSSLFDFSSAIDDGVTYGYVEGKTAKIRERNECYSRCSKSESLCRTRTSKAFFSHDTYQGSRRKIILSPATQIFRMAPSKLREEIIKKKWSWHPTNSAKFLNNRCGSCIRSFWVKISVETFQCFDYAAHGRSRGSFLQKRGTFG